MGRAWPAEFGGGGRPPAEQLVVDQELAAAGAPELVVRRRAGRARSRAPRVRDRRAAAAPRPADPLGRRGLEPGLLRARGGVRSRVAPHERRGDGGRLGAERAEDVDLVGPVLAVVRRPRADRSRRPPPQGDLAVHRRHGIAGGRGPADGADHRPRRVLRALPRRRPSCPADRSARRSRTGLADRDARRRARARHGGAPAAGDAADLARPAGRRGRGDHRRRPTAARRRAHAVCAGACARRDRGRCATTPPARCRRS